MTLPEECVYLWWGTRASILENRWDRAALNRLYDHRYHHDQIQDETGFAINNIGIGHASIVYAANHSAAKSNLNKFNLGSFVTCLQ